ncbi:unnamed protein product, partial [Polarella glacialis]
MASIAHSWQSNSGSAWAAGGKQTGSPALEWLLEQRLQAQRRVGSPPQSLPLLGLKAEVAQSSIKAAKSCKKGEVVFVAEALACVYEDEVSAAKKQKQSYACARKPETSTGKPATNTQEETAPQHGSLLGKLVEQLPRTAGARALVAAWGLGPGSESSEVSCAFQQYSQSTWCFQQAGSSSRIPGLVIFSFSGLLQHSQEPALVLTYVANGCIAVAARDLQEDEALTACLAQWRFDEASHRRELVASGACQACIWPKALPPPDSVQMAAAAHFLAAMERVAWAELEDETAQQASMARLREWLAEFDVGSRGSSRRQSSLLKDSPYLCLRAHCLALHLCTGSHRLDAAWDSALRVMELLPGSHLPLHEASELCVALALLGAALAFQQGQPDRAQQLFWAGSGLLAELFSLDSSSDRDRCWDLWMKTFLPDPLLGAALGALTTARSAAKDPGVVQETSRDPLGLSSYEDAESYEPWEGGSGL